jgi:uncharacterized membrane protein YphA (DoxX/SURF4 family)
VKGTPFTVSRVSALLIRTGLGIVFLWASWDKIIHPAAFAEIIENYQILPVTVVPPIAIALPWIECVCGLLLISGRLVPGAALTVALLLLIFTLITGFNLYRGLDVTCGCFSVSPESGHNAALTLARSGLLLAAGIWLMIHTLKQPGHNRLEEGRKAGQHAG